MATMVFMTDSNVQPPATGGMMVSSPPVTLDEQFPGAIATAVPGLREVTESGDVVTTFEDPNAWQQGEQS